MFSGGSRRTFSCAVSTIKPSCKHAEATSAAVLCSGRMPIISPSPVMLFTPGAPVNSLRMYAARSFTPANTSSFSREMTFSAAAAQIGLPPKVGAVVALAQHMLAALT